MKKNVGHLIILLSSTMALGSKPQMTSLENPNPTRDVPRRNLCDLYLATKALGKKSPLDLGNLRLQVGQTLILTDNTSHPPIFYQVDIHETATLPPEIRNIVKALVKKSFVKEMQREVAAETIRFKDQKIAVQWTSNNPSTNLGDDAWPAVIALYQQARNNEEINRQVIMFGGENIFHDSFHTHPSFLSAPHSGQDIIGLYTNIIVNSRNNLGPRAVLRTHVIPLGYGGEIIITHDPSKHRAAQLQ